MNGAFVQKGLGPAIKLVTYKRDYNSVQSSGLRLRKTLKCIVYGECFQNKCGDLPSKDGSQVHCANAQKGLESAIKLVTYKRDYNSAQSSGLRLRKTLKFIVHGRFLQNIPGALPS